jgi:hypothetical protein
MDNRAQTSVVGKTLEAGIVVLYVGLLVTTLYGGVVPAYEATAGESVAERTLASAAERIQQAVPPAARSVESRTRVSLPPTIAGAAYEVHVVNRTLVLDHPDDLGTRIRLALPKTVTRVEGRWRSGEPAVVRVEGTTTGLVVRLEGSV